ncbi:MAG: prepilin-type N-terminal cleavage/methylation domain-containing protein [Candidatus Aminicenantes bacterium]|nr:prepilin-type N-terminal cleavage/methylation domain-containing protein [Candidatus Aminicenantes bacterium]
MNKRGFTLIELLIVVAIIGIVAAIAIPNLLTALQKGKQKATMGDMKSIGTSIEAYIADVSIAPQSAALPTTGTTWFCPFYIKVMPRADGWGRVVLYAHGTAAGGDGDIYSIASTGRDTNFSGWNQLGDYLCTQLSDFNNDIIFSNGIFTYSPRVKL